jgi:hypothetical protein
VFHPLRKEDKARGAAVAQLNYADRNGASSLRASREIFDLAAGSGVWGIALAEQSPQVRISAVWFCESAIAERSGGFTLGARDQSEAEALEHSRNTVAVLSRPFRCWLRFALAVTIHLGGKACLIFLRKDFLLRQGYGGQVVIRRLQNCFEICSRLIPRLAQKSTAQSLRPQLNSWLRSSQLIAASRD